MNGQNQNLPSATSDTSGRQPQKDTGLSNAYCLWCEENKNKFLQKSGKINKKLMGEKWKELDESEKKPFKEKAKQLREEHMRLYPDFNKNYSYQAFMVFYEHRKWEVALKYPEIGFKEIKNLLGEEWKQLKDNEKKPFLEEARLLIGKQTQVYSNEYHPHEKPHIAANPKMSAISNETNLRLTPSDAMAFVTPQIGEHDSDNHPKKLSIPNASHFPSNDTGGHPPSCDADESMINFQLNSLATSSFAGAYSGLNQTYRYYIQSDDHNVLNQDVLKSCEKFKNCNSSDTQKIQLEKFSPSAFCPIQTVPLDLSFVINEDMNCCEKLRNRNSSESQEIQQQEDFSFPIQTKPLDLSCKKLN